MASNGPELADLPVAPLWWDTAPPAPRFAPLEQHRQADVVVVGAGYTGLWTAHYLAEADPALRIVVLDAEAVGYGASGRNGGWCSALLPMGLAAIARRFSPEAATLMQRAMHATVGEVVERCAAMGIDAGIARGGTLTVARSALHASQLHKDLAEYRRYGFGPHDVTWLGPAETAERTTMAGQCGALFTPHCAAVHPAQLVHGLAAAVAAQGVTIHERSPVVRIGHGSVRTARGSVSAPVVVRATEAFTSRLAGHRRSIAPVYSLMIATEPLDAAQLATVGLHHRETFTDGRLAVIYGQRTADDRVAFGGRGAPYHFASSLTPRHDGNARIHRRLAETLGELFPALRGVRITHRWGGAVGIARDMWCSVGFDRSAGVAWAGGYVGDGVATTNLAGRTLRDLILDRRTELTELAWVGHRSPQWEPEPLRWLGINGTVLLPTSIDRAEARRGRPAQWRRAVLDRLTGG